MKHFAGKNTMKLSKMVAACALKVTAANANSTCVWITHQESMPKAAKKLRKF